MEDYGTEDAKTIGGSLVSGNTAAPSKPGELVMAIEDLRHAKDMVTQELTHFIEKLHPVLSPVTDDNAQKADNPAKYNSDHANTVHFVTNDLKQIGLIIRKAAGALEV